MVCWPRCSLCRRVLRLVVALSGSWSSIVGVASSRTSPDTGAPWEGKRKTVKFCSFLAQYLFPLAILERSMTLFLDSGSLRTPLFQGLDGSPGCLHSITWAVSLVEQEVEGMGRWEGQVDA